jgi:hypothetical protein
MPPEKLLKSSSHFTVQFWHSFIARIKNNLMIVLYKQVIGKWGIVIMKLCIWGLFLSPSASWYFSWISSVLPCKLWYNNYRVVQDGFYPHYSKLFTQLHFVVCNSAVKKLSLTMLNNNPKVRLLYCVVSYLEMIYVLFLTLSMIQANLLTS